MINQGIIFTLEEVSMLLKFCDDKLIQYIKESNLTRQGLQDLVKVTVKLDGYERFLRDERFKELCNCGARMDDEIGEDKSHPFAESVIMGMDGKEK